MKIAVIHLTRMQRGFVCVAGVDVADGRQIRPVIPRGRLPVTMSAHRGGPFDMATVVDLGDVRAVGEPPDVEDYEFTQWHARATRDIEPDLFWEMLHLLAQPSARQIFGPALHGTGRGRASVAAGAGIASLGCLTPRGRPELYLTDRPGGAPAVRLRFSDGEMRFDLSVTDLRLYGSDHVTPDIELLGRVEQRIQRGVPILLSVGLTRPFAAKAGDEPVHWLQVNNLHLEDDPAWRLVPFQPPALVGSGVGGDLDDDLPF